MHWLDPCLIQTKEEVMSIYLMMCEVTPDVKRIEDLESMVESLASSQEIHTAASKATDIPNLIKTISDVGIMIVLSAVTVLFLMKVLTILLDQTKKASDELLPKIRGLADKITETQSQLSNLIMNHNQSTNKKLSALEIHLNQLNEKANRLESRLDNCDNDHESILIEVEKLEGLIRVRNEVDDVKNEEGSEQS